MTAITPTVGRIVHYYPTNEDSGAIISLGQPLAATIAHVWNERCINIAYLDTNGVWRSKSSVLLVHEDDEARPGAGYCAWMPYQIGQAAKAESLERQLVNVPVKQTTHDPDMVQELLTTRVPILDQITELCHAIELCGASPELTHAVTLASDLRKPISELVRQAIALDIGAGIASVNVSSPPSVTADDAVEREIQAKGRTAPRITPTDIEAAIGSVHYFIASDAIQHDLAVHECGPEGWRLGSTQLLTICVLQLRNGFTVTGESACASPENFDAEIGRKIARQNAVQKVWPLEGYLLRERLHQRAMLEAEPKTGRGAQE